MGSITQPRQIDRVWKKNDECNEAVWPVSIYLQEQNLLAYCGRKSECLTWSNQHEIKNANEFICSDVNSVRVIGHRRFCSGF